MNKSPAFSNRYEKIMVAAREARRLNERHIMSRIEPKEKVTIEAIRRAEHGEVEYAYDDFDPEVLDPGPERSSSSDEER